MKIGIVLLILGAGTILADYIIWGMNVGSLRFTFAWCT